MHEQLPATTATKEYSIVEMREIAKDMASSGLFAMKTTEQVFALMLLCQSEGLHPVQAMKRYHIIEGRPSMRADAMQAEFMRMGGVVEWVVSDSQVCEAIFSHPSSPKPFPVRLTLKEFVDSGLAMCWNREQGKMVLKDNWRKSPAAMLRARAISAGVRAVLPGVVAGVYTPEEVADFDDKPQPPPPTTVTRGTARTPSPAPAATPADYHPIPPVSPAATVAPVLTVATTPAAAMPVTAATEPVAQPTSQPASEPVELAPELALDVPATSPVTTSDEVQIPQDFTAQKRLFSKIGLVINSHDPDACAALKADWNACADGAARSAVIQKAIAECTRLNVTVPR